MRAGHGRGYYGVGQLAQSAPRRRSWFTVVAVLGVGAAVVWLLWPRRVPPDFASVAKVPERPSATPPPAVSRSPQISAIDTTGSALMTSATGAFLKQLEDDARSRNFTSVKDYEDSVVMNAKQLQSVGAKVVLAPHLQHLAPRLES